MFYDVSNLHFNSLYKNACVIYGLPVVIVEDSSVDSVGLTDVPVG